MICKNCGRNATSDSMICSNCGAPIQNMGFVNNRMATNGSGNQYIMDVYNNNKGVYEGQAKEHGNMFIGIALLIVVLIIIIGIAIATLAR